MATHTYSATVSVHKTLTATTVDTVTINVVRAYGQGAVPEVVVVNRSGTAEIYFTVGTTDAPPEDPTVGGDTTYVVPEAITSTTVGAYPGNVVVKLISSGTEKYSVEAI